MQQNSTASLPGNDTGNSVACSRGTISSTIITSNTTFPSEYEKMASGIRPPSSRKEDGRTPGRNEYREFPAHTRRNPSMDVPEKKDRTGSHPHDDLCARKRDGAFAGTYAIGRQPVYGVAWRTCSGRHSGRADGTFQVYAGLLGGCGGNMCRPSGKRRMGTGGERPAHRIRRRAGGNERKSQSGGETGHAGMRRGGHAGGVCGEGEIMPA